jgi:hypothetical protein
VRNESAVTADLGDGVYDVVVISLFSTATALPREHAVVPVFPDDEGGVVERFYARSRILTVAYERAKMESPNCSAIAAWSSIDSSSFRSHIASGGRWLPHVGAGRRARFGSRVRS